MKIEIKAERMLDVPWKEKSTRDKGILIMTENTENPEYLSSKIEMMSSLKNLPDLGSLLMDLFHFIVFLLAFIIPLNMGMKRGDGRTDTF